MLKASKIGDASALLSEKRRLEKLQRDLEGVCASSLSGDTRVRIGIEVVGRGFGQDTRHELTLSGRRLCVIVDDEIAGVISALRDLGVDAEG